MPGLEDEINEVTIDRANQFQAELYIETLRDHLGSLGVGNLQALMEAKDAAMKALLAALEVDDAAKLSLSLAKGTSEEVMAVLSGLSGKDGGVGELVAKAQTAKKAADDWEGPIKRVRELIALCRIKAPIGGRVAPAKGGGKGTGNGAKGHIKSYELPKAVDDDMDRDSARDRERGLRDDLFQRGLSVNVEED